jgi:hypothetical protein
MWRYIVTVKVAGDQRREIGGTPALDYPDQAFAAAMQQVDAHRVAPEDVTRVVIYRSN